MYISATVGSEDDCDNYYDCSNDNIDEDYEDDEGDEDDDDEDESLSDSFSDYETDRPNWRVQRLQREEYLAVYNIHVFVHIEIEATVHVYAYMLPYIVSDIYYAYVYMYIGTSLLCQHNFEHNG